jgi:hypothetical protein
MIRLALLHLTLTSSSSSNRSGLCSTGLALARVLDIVPRDVQKQRLDGEGLEARRVGDDVGEVDAAGGIIGQAGRERGLRRR